MKAVYHISNSRTWGRAATQVWAILKQEGFLPESIFFYDKLKGCYKDLVRKPGKEFQIQIYKHRKLQNPKELEWKNI